MTREPEILIAGLTEIVLHSAVYGLVSTPSTLAELEVLARLVNSEAVDRLLNRG